MAIDPKTLSEKIVEVVPSVDDIHVLDDLKIGGDYENEMLMFIKPEVFMDAPAQEQVNAVEMMLSKLNDYDAHVDGVVVLGGGELDRREIMNRHYGFINQMSRGASEAVSAQDKHLMSDILGVDVDEYEVLGGHELLDAFPGLTTEELDRWWFEDSSKKVRSGFYVRNAERDGRKVVMVNAFHPEQLAHFTRPERRIVAILVKANQAWAKMRDELIGETFPEKASGNSIRGTLFRSPREFGFDSVSIANNAVHLSAGPVEALFEINNFFKDTLGVDVFGSDQPRLVQFLLENGLEIDEIADLLENPRFEHGGVSDDLYTHTEHLDTSDAGDIWLRYKGKK